MRAVYLPDSFFKANEQFAITGEKTHHLLNVVRIKKDSSLLLLNGKGASAKSKVLSISKKEIVVDVDAVEEQAEESTLSIAFAQPKKDALELCLKNCVEVGAKEIYILGSERSQVYPLKEERVLKILANAIEQSNNPFMPELKIIDFKDLDLSNFETVALASLAQEGTQIIKEHNKLLVIGPEGGFTEDEEELLLKNRNVLCVNFKGPILRAPTAISFFAGRLTP